MDKTKKTLTPAAKAPPPTSAPKENENVTRLEGLDVIDELCFYSVFEEAAKYLTGAHALRLSQDQQLQFYALFKQATRGPCTTARPGMLHFVERAKWDAWHALGSMTKDEAIVRYVNSVEAVAPQWRKEAPPQSLDDLDTDEDTDEEEEEEKEVGEKGKAEAAAKKAAKKAARLAKAEAKRRGAGGAPGAFSHAVSRPVFDHEAEDSAADAMDKQDTQSEVSNTPLPHPLWHYAMRGDLERTRASLRQNPAGLLDTDAESRTALHLACDRGHLDIVRTLVSFAAEAAAVAATTSSSTASPSILRALLDCQDADRQTALHYACICDHTDIAVVLASSLASLTLTDADGETALAHASDSLRQAVEEAVVRAAAAASSA